MTTPIGWPTTAPDLAVMRPLWKRAIPVMLGIVITAAIAGIAGWMLKPSPSPPTAVTRFSFSLPDGQQFTGAGGKFVAIAPDGSQLVYVANNRLYLKPMGEMSSVVIQGTEVAAGVANPVFSPDSQSLAFYSKADKTIKRIAISGGAAVTICAVDETGLAEGSRTPYGMSWGADNEILIGEGSQGIVRVSANGGKPETIVRLKEGELAHGPQALPGTGAVLFTLTTTAKSRWDKAQIVVQSLKSGERKVLVEGGRDARYVPDGHLIYVLAGTLLTVPFDAQRMEVTGGPVPVVEGVKAAIANLTGTSQFSISSNGSLIFVPGASLDDLQQLTWYDRAGKAVEKVGDPGQFPGIDLSPDGKRIAVHRHEGEGGDVWVFDPSHRTPMRLTFDASQENAMPVWSPDGKRIVFQSLRNGKWGLYQKNSDGTGGEDLLIESDLLKMPMTWSRDGQSIVYTVRDPKTGSDLWLLPLTGERKAIPLLNSRFGENDPQISPDGKWMAYNTSDSGRAEVYVRSFPKGDGKWQVSTSGGVFPRWRGDGKELFFVTNAVKGKVMAVGVNGAGSRFEAGTPAELFDGGNYGGVTDGHQGNYFVYAVSPDGQRFLMSQSLSTGNDSESPTINVVLNWPSLLKR